MGGGLCNCPGGVQTNSALIDGVYPSGVIDTTDPNWARDFFTISRNGESVVRIGFQWSSGFELRGVELKLFNCAPEGTAIQTINVYASITFPAFTPLVVPPGLVGTYLPTGNDLDCTGVKTVVIPTTPVASLANYFLEFSFPQGENNTGIYIVEAQFSDTAITVPSETSSTPPSLSLTPTAQIIASAQHTLSTSVTSTSDSTSLVTSLSFTSPMSAIVSTTNSLLSPLEISSLIIPTSSPAAPAIHTTMTKQSIHASKTQTTQPILTSKIHITQTEQVTPSQISVTSSHKPQISVTSHMHTPTTATSGSSIEETPSPSYPQNLSDCGSYLSVIFGLAGVIVVLLLIIFLLALTLILTRVKSHKLKKHATRITAPQDYEIPIISNFAANGHTMETPHLMKKDDSDLSMSLNEAYGELDPTFLSPLHTTIYDTIPDILVSEIETDDEVQITIDLESNQEKLRHASTRTYEEVQVFDD